MKKNFLKKVCVAAMAVVMTVGSTMSAMAAEYKAYLKYMETDYWPVNVYYNSEDNKFLPEGASAQISGPGTYTLKISIEELEKLPADADNDGTIEDGELFSAWNNPSGAPGEIKILVLGAATEFADYEVKDIKLSYDGTKVWEAATYEPWVWENDFGITIYENNDWYNENSTYDFTQATFSDNVEVTFTLVDPNAQPESSSESESSSEAGGSGSGSGSNSGSGSGSGESGTPSTGDSSMVAAFVALAAVSALVVLKKRTVNE